MDNDLIGQVFDHFIDSRSAVERAITGQRTYLQRMADQGKLTEAYANVMNTLLGSMADHMEAMDELLGLIGLTPSMDTEAFARDYRSIASLDAKRQRQIWHLIHQYERLKRDYEMLRGSYETIAASDVLMSQMLYKKLVATADREAVRQAFSEVDEHDQLILNVINSTYNSHEVRTSNGDRAGQERTSEAPKQLRKGSSAAA